MATKKKGNPQSRKPSGWAIVERRGRLEWPTLTPNFATRLEADEAIKNMLPKHGGELHSVPKSKTYANTPPAKKRRLRREVRRSRR
jgi:hypothetical protein